MDPEFLLGGFLWIDGNGWFNVLLSIIGLILGTIALIAAITIVFRWFAGPIIVLLFLAIIIGIPCFFVVDAVWRAPRDGRGFMSALPTLAVHYWDYVKTYNFKDDMKRTANLAEERNKARYQEILEEEARILENTRIHNELLEAERRAYDEMERRKEARINSRIHH